MSDTFTITTESGRIDKIITAHETTHTRSQVQKWLQDGLVTVNGNPVKANFKVTAGDVVTVTIPEVKPLKAVAAGRCRTAPSRGRRSAWSSRRRLTRG